MSELNEVTLYLSDDELQSISEKGYVPKSVRNQIKTESGVGRGEWMLRIEATNSDGTLRQVTEWTPADRYYFDPDENLNDKTYEEAFEQSVTGYFNPHSSDAENISIVICDWDLQPWDGNPTVTWEIVPANPVTDDDVVEAVNGLKEMLDE